MKLYKCKILSENKKTGGFQISSRGDGGETVTRHVDRFLQGKNPNGNAVKLHDSAQKLVVEYVESISSVEKILAESRAKLAKGANARTTVELRDSISWAEVRLIELNEHLHRAELTRISLNEEMPLTAQFVVEVK